MLQEQELSFGRVNFPAHMAEITTTETPEIVPKGNGATQNPVIARSCGFNPSAGTAVLFLGIGILQREIAAKEMPIGVQERMRWSGSALARQIQSNGDQGFPH